MQIGCVYRVPTGWTMFYEAPRLMDVTSQLNIAVADGPNGNGCLEFEKPLAELEGQIAELKSLQAAKGINYSPELRALRSKLVKRTAKIYSH